MEWISVKDRLPEKDGYYMVKKSKMSMQGREEWIEDKCQFKRYKAQSGHDIPVWQGAFDWIKVTHWKSTDLK